MATKHQQESIYNLIPREYEQQTRPPRHSSKFKSSTGHDVEATRADHKTMGQAKIPVRAPQEFLKKHEKEPKLPDKSGFQYGDQEKRKPPVPSHHDQPIMGLRTTKNFITQNAVENILSVAKKCDKNFVDTKTGSKQRLETSGLEPKYIHKKEYGQAPPYLLHRKEEMKQAQAEYDAYIAEHFRRGAMQHLNEEERQLILDGLKTNWENIHHEYLGLSVVTDTAPKKNRKERMEAEMKQLERDIELIEKHRIIYIAN